MGLSSVQPARPWLREHALTDLATFVTAVLKGIEEFKLRNKSEEEVKVSC